MSGRQFLPPEASLAFYFPYSCSRMKISLSLLILVLLFDSEYLFLLLPFHILFFLLWKYRNIPCLFVNIWASCLTQNIFSFYYLFTSFFFSYVWKYRNIPGVFVNIWVSYEFHLPGYGKLYSKALSFWLHEDEVTNFACNSATGKTTF